MSNLHSWTHPLLFYNAIFRYGSVHLFHVLRSDADDVSGEPYVLGGDRVHDQENYVILQENRLHLGSWRSTCKEVILLRYVLLFPAILLRLSEAKFSR